MIELLTCAQMAEADRRAIAGGTGGLTLMENAGAAVADRALAMGARDVVVVAGPGNNGGDGFVAARLLAARGIAVLVLLLGARARLRGDAAAMAACWSGAVAEASAAGLAGAGLIIDALFGAGLDRPVEGAAAGMIAAINASGVPVLSVDLPSGISGDSGAVMGEAVKAAETVTFFRRKPGHLLLPGRLHCGRLSLVDIGIAPAVLAAIKPQTYANEPELWADVFPVPGVGGHKYDRGHTVVVSGDLPTTGAARLAARGALRIGSGLVTIVSPRAALLTHAAENVAIMVRPVDGSVELAAFLGDKRRNSVVLGPGGGVGPSLRDLVMTALASDAAVVLDADALLSFAQSPPVLAAAIAKRSRPVVLTPHEGEFTKLFIEISSDSNVKSKLEKTQLAAGECGATVLLKGPDTVIASPDGRAAITANAPPILATAGSGDVLAGMISGLLAQGMPAFEAACAGAWLHGEAANAFGPGLIAEDIPEALPRVLTRFLGGSA